MKTVTSAPVVRLTPATHRREMIAGRDSIRASDKDAGTLGDPLGKIPALIVDRIRRGNECRRSGFPGWRDRDRRPPASARCNHHAFPRFDKTGEPGRMLQLLRDLVQPGFLKETATGRPPFRNTASARSAAPEVAPQQGARPASLGQGVFLDRAVTTSPRAGRIGVEVRWLGSAGLSPRRNRGTAVADRRTRIETVNRIGLRLVFHTTRPEQKGSVGVGAKLSPLKFRRSAGRVPRAESAWPRETRLVRLQNRLGRVRHEPPPL